MVSTRSGTHRLLFELCGLAVMLAGGLQRAGVQPPHDMSPMEARFMYAIMLLSAKQNAGRHQGCVVPGPRTVNQAQLGLPSPATGGRTR